MSAAVPGRFVEDYPGALRTWLQMRRAEIVTAVANDPATTAACVRAVADELLRLVDELVPGGDA